MPGSERAEVYDPTLDVWREVGSLNKPRKMPSTVGLPDGTAIVIGGINTDDVSFSSTKVYSPSTDSWSDGPLLNVARGTPTAVALPDGRVLVVSDDGRAGHGQTLEVLDARRQAWAAAAGPGERMVIQSMTLLDDGIVLAIGSGSDEGLSEPFRAAWLYDPATGAWRPVDAPDMLPTDLIPIVGGAFALGFSDESELLGRFGGPSRAVGSRFDPSSGTWSPVRDLPTQRFLPQAARTPDGRVLVAGGRDSADGGTVLASAELYDPLVDRWIMAPSLLAPRENGHAVAFGDGTVLVFGGDDTLNVFGDTPFCPPALSNVERLFLAP
jgi:hypothetical protein